MIRLCIIFPEAMKQLLNVCDAQSSKMLYMLSVMSFISVQVSPLS